LFGFPGVDPYDQKLLLPEVSQKVLRLGGIILPAEEHMLGANLPLLGAASDLAQQPGGARQGVLDGEAGFEQIPDDLI
jgi:hypothetical protein